jgi:hypothetical protein
MSIETEKPPLDVQRFSDGKILEASRVPFVICGLAIVALIALLVIQATTNAKFLGGYVTETDSALVRFMLAGSLYIGLFVIALASAYIGIAWSWLRERQLLSLYPRKIMRCWRLL